MKILRKLIISVVSLVAVVICFIATTYAWFDVNSEANVEGFNFTAISGEGFVVSVDGSNYGSFLTNKQMKYAMVRGYKPNEYTIENNKLYNNSGVEVSDSEVDKILQKEILLYPLTSNDGISLQNIIGSTAATTSGKFIEFDIYFKTTSDVAEDKRSYDIYVCGEDLTQMDGSKVEKTSIVSHDVDVIAPARNLVTYNGTPEGLIVGPEQAVKSVNVYTSNSLRFSIQDTTLDTPKATIYELTNEFDLGSYATDYDGDDAELQRLYSAKYNAGFTHYNNTRPDDPITELKYEDKPETVRTLTDEQIITNVTAGSGEKKLTFRFWLEGWDADCFDGLSKSMSVKLLFNSIKVDMP